MKTKKQTFLFALTFLFLFGCQTSGGNDFLRGVDADQRKDYKEAVRLYRLSAKQGYAQGQYNLGLRYYDGLAVPQDYKEAVKWYRLSAKQGFAKAQYNLGLSYFIGQGVPQDYKEAVKWWKLAAEQGLEIAQYNLGGMYYQGKGLPKDYVSAHMWFNICSPSKDEECMDNRNIVEKEMTPSQIEKAQELARNWQPKK